MLRGGLQRGMDLWGDDAAFCQITLTSCLALLKGQLGYAEFNFAVCGSAYLSTSGVFIALLSPF